MDAQEIKERIFRYMIRVRQQEAEQKEWAEKEKRYSAYSSGLAFGKVLAMAYLIGYLELGLEFQKWSEDREKDQNSKKN